MYAHSPSPRKPHRTRPGSRSVFPSQFIGGLHKMSARSGSSPALSMKVLWSLTWPRKRKFSTVKHYRSVRCPISRRIIITERGRGVSSWRGRSLFRFGWAGLEIVLLGGVWRFGGVFWWILFIWLRLSSAGSGWSPRCWRQSSYQGGGVP